MIQFNINDCGIHPNIMTNLTILLSISILRVCSHNRRVEQNVGNEIVECQECHSLYHIECHRQGLINENVKDPRFVWYCSACTSRRKKAKVPGKTTAPLSSNGSISKDSTPQNAENSPFKSWSFIKK